MTERRRPPRPKSGATPEPSRSDKNSSDGPGRSRRGRKSFGPERPRRGPQTTGPDQSRRRQAQPPELLAPAGSKASWAAAVEAGADAVYLGLNDFSARAYADNFSLAELAAVIRQSRQAGVKVYLALNALIKEGELESAWKLLATSASFGPDALILQDQGLARLAARHFPEVPRHASTLTAVHSLPGLIMLERAGFSRAVLARELAFDEVAALAAHSPIEVEVFNHGALCFSFSGLCLMSSFLGGRSALRGACTQPCRRVYQRGGHKGAFFSTTDLSTAPYFNELRRLPLSAFKIEGRMKGPDYVSRVVRAYRILLDAPEADWPYALAEAENLLSEAPGRRTTGGPLAASIEGALAPLNATTSGIKLGFVEPAGPERGRLTLERAVKLDDRLRLQVKAGEESAGFNLKTIIIDGREADSAPAGQEVVLGGPNFPDHKGLLFKVSSGSEEKFYAASPLVRAVKEEAKKTKLPPPKAPPAELKPRGRVPGGGRAAARPSEAGRAAFWVWLEKADDLRELAGFEARRIILALTVPNVRQVHRQRRHLKNELPRLVWSLPPLIFHRRQNILNQELRGLIEGGAREFMVSNIAQINMIQRAGPEAAGLKIWGDHRLGVLNHLAEEALTELGLRGLTLSPEADADTFQRLWRTAPAQGGGRLIYLYGHPALFTARFPLELRQIPVISPKGEKFRIGREGEETVVVAERPVFMGPLLKMPPLPGGEGFILDLRHEAHIGPKLRELKKALAGGGSGPGSSFNFKRTLM